MSTVLQIRSSSYECSGYIRFGKKNATDEEVIQPLKWSGLMIHYAVARGYDYELQKGHRTFPSASANLSVRQKPTNEPETADS